MLNLYISSLVLLIISLSMVLLLLFHRFHRCFLVSGFQLSNISVIMNYMWNSPLLSSVTTVLNFLLSLYSNLLNSLVRTGKMPASRAIKPASSKSNPFDSDSDSEFTSKLAKTSSSYSVDPGAKSRYKNALHDSGGFEN